MYKRQKSPYGYQPNSPLTIHYITTGAILPEKDKKKNIKCHINKMYDTQRKVIKL